MSGLDCHFIEIILPTIEQALATFSLPRSELRALLCCASPALTVVQCIAHPHHILDEALFSAFCALAKRRVAGEPMAYVLGKREFYGRCFQVNADVMVPRPETELLVDCALQCHRTGPLAVLDLGCGSGVIAITLALEAPLWRVCAVDLSTAALQVARLNALSLAAPVSFFLGSWFDALATQDCFDLIVSNPPYIAKEDPHLLAGDLRFEPKMALTDGADGLVAHRTIIRDSPLYLRPAGWLMLEHGFDQGQAVRDFFKQPGWCAVNTLRDLAGCERLTVGQRVLKSERV